MSIKSLDVFVVNNQYVTQFSRSMVYLALSSKRISDDSTDLFYVEIGYTHRLGVERQTGILSMFEFCNRGIAKFSTSMYRGVIHDHQVSVVGKLDRFCVNGFLEDFFNPKRFIKPNTELLEKAFRYFSVIMNDPSEEEDQLLKTYMLPDFGFGFNHDELEGTIEFEVPLTTEEEKRRVFEKYGYTVNTTNTDRKAKSKKHKSVGYKSSHSARTSLSSAAQEDAVVRKDPVFCPPKSEQKYYSTALFKCDDDCIPYEVRMQIQKYGVSDILDDISKFEERSIQPLDDIVNNPEIAKSFIEEYRSMSIKRFCNLYGYSKEELIKIIESIILKYKIR